MINPDVLILLLTAKLACYEPESSTVPLGLNYLSEFTDDLSTPVTVHVN